MKIGVIGDTHLGAAFSLGTKDVLSGVNTRLVDYQSTLISTIDSLAEKGCKQLCFTGDIFEHRIPSVKQQEFFSTALRHAVEKGFEHIHIVEGNHDQQRISSASTVSYLKELGLPNIHVYDEVDLFVAKDGKKPLANIIFMPYRDRKWFNTDSQDVAIKQLDEILSYCVSSIDNSAVKLVVGHMTIEGTMWMLDQYAELYNGNDLVLPVSMFNGIDITVMGHVHTPGVVSKKPFIYYIGSMEKRGAFEAHEKKYMIIDTETKKLAVYSEPCREIHDIAIDFSNEVCSDRLMSKITEKIEAYSEKSSLKDAIVRILLTISAEDSKFCDTKAIEASLISKHNIFHCVEIKPSLMFSRQARDTQINENASDTEAFTRYLKSSIKDSNLIDETLAKGLEIISALNGVE